MRRPRTKPTATELARVQKILEAQLAFRTLLGRKVRIEKRTGEVVSISKGTIAVAKAMTAKRISPERAHVGSVLRVADEVLRAGNGLPSPIFVRLGPPAGSAA